MPNATSDLGVEMRFPLVLPRNETRHRRITTEIISIKYDFAGAVGAVLTETAAGSANHLEGVRVALSYRPLIAAEVAPGLPTATIGDIAILDIADFEAFLNIDGTPANSQIVPFTSLVEHNLTGGTGRGLIIPGDRIFYNINTGVNLSTKTMGVVIYYRQHLVDTSEYLGILAGFQQNPS